MSDSKAHYPSPLELVYKHINGIDISMDVYIPERATETAPAPVLLWWHGEIFLHTLGIRRAKYCSGGGLLQVRRLSRTILDLYSSWSREQGTRKGEFGFAPRIQKLNPPM